MQPTAVSAGTVGLVAAGRRTGVHGLLDSSDRTIGNAAQMQAAVEYLEKQPTDDGRASTNAMKTDGPAARGRRHREQSKRRTMEKRLTRLSTILATAMAAAILLAVCGDDSER